MSLGRKYMVSPAQASAFGFSSCYAMTARERWFRIHRELGQWPRQPSPARTAAQPSLGKESTPESHTMP